MTAAEFLQDLLIVLDVLGQGGVESLLHDHVPLPVVVARGGEVVCVQQHGVGLLQGDLGAVKDELGLAVLKLQCLADTLGLEQLLHIFPVRRLTLGPHPGVA